MAYENLGKCLPFPAASDLSPYQYRFVKLNSAARIALSGLGEDAIGVLQDDPAALDRTGSVMISPGVTKVVAGGATHAGFQVASDASGRAIDSATGEFILGFFLEAAAQAGDIVSILFQPRASVR